MVTDIVYNAILTINGNNCVLHDNEMISWNLTIASKIENLNHIKTFIKSKIV